MSRIESGDLRQLLDQLEALPTLSLRTIVWARHIGDALTEFKVCRDEPEPDDQEGEWDSRGCLEAILRRGL